MGKLETSIVTDIRLAELSNTDGTVMSYELRGRYPDQLTFPGRQFNLAALQPESKIQKCVQYVIAPVLNAKAVTHAALRTK